MTRPHHAPYTLSPDDHELGVGVDALYALAVRMQGQVAESWPAQAGARSVVCQAVCSPFRNPLARRDRTVLRAVRRVPVLGRALRRIAHAVGVSDPEAGWRLTQKPTSDNQLATLNLDVRHAWLRIERTIPGDGTDPALQIR
ncbi:hypothetical protein BH20ACT16_BH20ACT16_05700 [soil metagenome]